MQTKTKKTVDDYMRLSDDIRVELIDGEYYMCPSPNARHQTAILQLASQLNSFVKSQNLGMVFIAPFDSILSEENVLQPDVLFIANEHLGRLRDRLYGPPDLAIEVLSPSNTERDRIVKRDLYAKFGVREYWIIDTELRTIEKMELESGSYRFRGIFGPTDILTSSFFPGLTLTVSDLFA